MDPLLDVVLEEKPEIEPNEFFKVSEAHKAAVSGNNGKLPDDVQVASRDTDNS
jgi:ATP-dependent Lon protease